MTGPQKIVIYGPGGIGKSKLVSLLASVGIRPRVLDLDNNSGHLAVDRIGTDELQSLDDVRDALHTESLWSNYGAVAIDSATRLEEYVANWVVENVPNEKGEKVSSLGGYGFSKELSHIYNAFLPIFADLEAHTRKGRHVILVCHECTSSVPNPQGEDWLRYEPRMQSPASGKSSIRHRIKEWCNHMLFVGYDVQAGKTGKASGVGIRTIYPNELPTLWAKSHALTRPILYNDGDPELWRQMFNVQ